MSDLTEEVSVSKLRCSVPVVDVPYDALQKDLAKAESCRKVRVWEGTAVSEYSPAHTNWAKVLQKKDSARCASNRVTGTKLDKALEDERRMKEAKERVLTCVHLQAIPDPYFPGKGLVFNPFSQEAVDFGGVPTNPDIRPLFDVRKCVSRCGAVTRSSSRSESLSKSRSRSRSKSGSKCKKLLSGNGSGAMSRRTGGSRLSSSRFSHHGANLVVLGGSEFQALLKAECAHKVRLVREDIVFLKRGVSGDDAVTLAGRFLELGPLGRAAATLFDMDPANVYDAEQIKKLCGAVFKCGPCPVKKSTEKEGLLSFAPTTGEGSEEEEEDDYEYGGRRSFRV
jgi:hypothetical protein